jgi:hypothetical protein
MPTRFKRRRARTTIRARKRTNKNKCKCRRSKKYSRRSRNYNVGGTVVFGSGSDDYLNSENSGYGSSESSESSGSSGSSGSSESSGSGSSGSSISYDRSIKKKGKKPKKQVVINPNCIPEYHKTREECIAAGCDPIDCMLIDLNKKLAEPNKIGARNLEEDIREGRRIKIDKTPIIY